MSAYTLQYAIELTEAIKAHLIGVFLEGNSFGTVNRMQLLSEVAEKSYPVLVKTMMRKNLDYFNAGEQVEGKFKMLGASPSKKFSVIQNKRFIGMVSLMCILEYLLLRSFDVKEHSKLKSL
jgi:predicted transcriptional regulator